MARILLILAAFALACGGQESTAPPGEVGAGVLEEDVVATTQGEEVPEEVPEEGDAVACLRLVSEANYDDAVAVCAEAALADPDNQGIQKALATARAKSAMPDRGDAANCLDLVARGEFQQAVVVCAEAAELNPDDTDITEALAKAKRETSQAAAGAAAKKLMK
jgi:Flp pilus assembly protein TadD